MLAAVIQIDGWDPVAAAPVTLRAASHDDPAVCHLEGLTWWPAIAKLPTLRYDYFDGAFGGAITAPTSSLTLRTEPWPVFGRYMLADARIRLWTAQPGQSWGSYTLRFDGRLRGQPEIADGAATIDFAVDDRWLDGALLPMFAGTTGAEGPDALKGAAKPLAIGSPRFVAGVLIDSVNSVFQVSVGAVEGIDVAMERVARFGAATGDYPTYAALVAATIPAGAWATARAVGMARFGAPPTGQVSFMVRGDTASADGWVRTPGKVIRRIAGLSGGAGRTHDASLTALDAAAPYPLSIFVDQQASARDLIQKVAASVNAVAVMSWTGKLFAAPVAIGAPTVTLAADGSALPPVSSVKQIEIAAPWKSLALTAERTWTVHPLADVAFTAPLVPRGLYDSAATYREGNLVDLADGSSWLFGGSTPTTGVAPADGNASWARQSEAVAVTPTGAWDGGRTYRRQEGVTSGGRFFASKASGNLGNAPPTTATDNAWWYLIADKGSAGAGAIAVRLDPPATTMRYDSANTVVTGQTVTWSVTRENSTTAVVFILYDKTGAALVSGPAATLAGTGYFSSSNPDTLTISSSQYASLVDGSPNREVLTLEVLMTDGGVTRSAQSRLSKIRDGAAGAAGANGVSAISGELTDGNHTVPAASDGTVLSYAGVGGEFVVRSGQTVISSAFTLSTVSNPQGLTIGYTGQSYAVTGGFDAGEDRATAVIRATGSGAWAGVTVERQISLSKTKTGAAGGDGSDAVLVKIAGGPFTVRYSAANSVVPGQVVTWNAKRQNSTAEPQWAVYDGNRTLLRGGSAAYMAASGYFDSPNPDTLSMSAAQYASLVDGSPARETLIVEVAIGHLGVVYTDEVSLAKLPAGAQGADGEDGTDGVDGIDGSDSVLLKLTPSTLFMAYDTSNVVIAGQSVNWTAQRQNASGLPDFTLYDRNGVSLRTGSGAYMAASGYFTSPTPDQIAMSAAQYASLVDGSPARETLVIEAAITVDGVVHRDRVALSKTRDGQAGQYTVAAYRRSATAPATPTDATTPPAGWAAIPPVDDGVTYLWETRADFRAGVRLTAWSAPFKVFPKGVQDDADQTAANQLVLSGPKLIVVPANSAGVVTDGLPITKSFRLTKGGVDISSQADYGASVQTGFSATINNTAGSAQRGDVTITALSQKFLTLNVYATYQGRTAYESAVIRRDDALPTASGGGGGGGTPGGAASATSFTSPGGSTTHVVMATLAAVRVGTSGTVALATTLNFGSAYEGAVALDDPTLTYLSAKWLYSADGSTGWSDVGGEATGSPATNYYKSEPPGGATASEGSVSISTSKTGLTSGNLAYFRLVGRKYSGNAIAAVSGFGQATPQ